MSEVIDECQINKELVNIKNSRPVFNCLNCNKCECKVFNFSLQDNKISCSMKCCLDDTLIEFCINNFYKEKDDNCIVTPMVSKKDKSLFTSTDELYDFVLSKLKNNITYKDKIISRINKTCYLNSKDKVNFINKIVSGFNKNIELNLECYKILHFLLYNDLTFKNKGYSFPFNDYINKQYQYNEMFDLVENSVYHLLSFYKYQYLIKFQYKHNYSYENSFELNLPINFQLTLYDGNLIGIDFFCSYFMSIKQKKIKIEKSFDYNDECKGCIQLNSEIILHFTNDKVCLVSIEYFVPIRVINLPDRMTNFSKISSGKIIGFEPGERKIIIFTFDEKKYTIKTDVVLKVENVFDYGVREYQENKIIFHDNARIYLYDCEHFQYEIIFDGFGCFCECNFCLLPNNKYAIAIYEINQIQIFDLKNPKLISQQKLPLRRYIYMKIKEGILSVNEELIFLFYGEGKYIFSQTKEKYVQLIENGIRDFSDDLTLLCDGRILVGYSRYMKLYSINEEVEIERIGYSKEAEKQIKDIEKRKKRGGRVYEENEMEPYRDSCFIHIDLNSEMIIVSLKEKTLFFF